MVVVVFWQFGLGALALFLRFAERPLLRCQVGCQNKINKLFCTFRRCCCCCCFCCCFDRCCQRSQAREALAKNKTPPVAHRFFSFASAVLGWLRARTKFRWYWFHLTMQVAFMIREFYVVSLLDGWGWEMTAAHVAIWLTIGQVVFEVWHFSHARAKAPEVVDEVLDMLLLPVNYGLFCVLCVRVLCLQASSQDRELVPAVLESADIWESWALWSVLGQFVRVVDVASRRDPRREHDSEYLEAIAVFKTLSLQGVKAWVLILASTVAFDLTVKGVIAPRAPTLCFWLYSECLSCEQWYDLHIRPSAQAVLYILCCFALVFVFTFERMFSEYLVGIQPYWKFWGVKGVVSVTYFQWLVISYCFGFDDSEIYRIHCLTCCIEMPLLALLHSTCAYPYGKPWLDALLEHEVVVKVLSHEACSAGHSAHPEELQDLPVPVISPSSASSIASSVGLLDNASASVAKASPVGASSSSPLGSSLQALEDAACPLNPIVFESIEVVDGLPLPAGVEKRRTCQAMTSSVSPINRESVEKMRGSLVSPPLEASQTDRVDGVPSHVELMTEESSEQCNGGDRFGTTARSVKVNDDDWLSAFFYGLLAIVGCCAAVRVIFHFAPPESDLIPVEHVYNFTCTSRDLAQFVTETSKDHHWLLPPDVANRLRMPAVAGAWLPLCGGVELGCGVGHTGRPRVDCSAEGEYTWSGAPCNVVVCGPPLQLPNAVPSFDGAQAHADWSSGMRVSYQCDDGFTGKPVAECGPDGKYTVRGKCTEVVCKALPDVPHAKLPAAPTSKDSRGDDGCCAGNCTNGTHSSNRSAGPNITNKCHAGGNGTRGKNGTSMPSAWRTGTRVHYECNHGYSGHPIAVCGDRGIYSVVGSCVVVCGDPPTIAHAVPQFDNEQASGGWTAGKRVPYQCNIGYGGSVTALCGQDGTYQVAGSCQVLCATPPEVAHAHPSFGVVDAQHGWIVGMRAAYRCDAGFEGHPVAQCGNDGHWSFSGDSCKYMGCRNFDGYMQATLGKGWQRSMAVESELNFTSLNPGEVTVVACKPGYSGRLVAACVRGQWSLAGRPCEAAQTARSCRCKTKWTLCRNMLLGGGCRARNGCAPSGLATSGEYYSWCEVEPGSCPVGTDTLWESEPSWDYCTLDSSNVNSSINTPKELVLEPLPTGYTTQVAILRLSAITAVCIFILLVVWISRRWLWAVMSLRQRSSRTGSGQPPAAHRVPGEDMESDSVALQAPEVNNDCGSAP